MLVVALVAAVALPAADYEPRVERGDEASLVYLAASGGLDHRNILDLDFEPGGSVWLAVSDGLYRFDGYRWRRFSTGQGLPSDFVRAVLVTAGGDVWAGTDRGAAVLRGDQFEAVATERLAGPSVRRIVEEPDGTLWFCSSRWPDPDTNGGLTRLRGGVWTQYHAPDEIPDDNVVDFFRDSSGRRYLITAIGLAVYSNGSWRDAPSISRAEGVSWQSAELAESADGRVLLNTGDGFFVLRDGRLDRRVPLQARLPHGIDSTSDGQALAFGFEAGSGYAFYRWDGRSMERATGRLRAPPTQFVERVRTSPDGSVWVVGFGYLLRWSRLASEWVKYVDLPPPKVVDGRGRVWFTSADEAITLDGERWQRFSFPYGPVRATPDGGVVATSPTEVAYFDAARKLTVAASELGLARILGADVDAQGRWWVHGLTRRGALAIRVYDGNEWLDVSTPQLDGVTRVSAGVDPTDGVWYLAQTPDSSTHRLIHARLGASSPRWSTLRLPDEAPNRPSLHVDSQGTPWICRPSGLGRWDSEAESLIPETLPSGAPFILSLADVGDALWVAASGHFGGNSVLLRREKNGDWTEYDASFSGPAVRAARGYLFTAGRREVHVVSSRGKAPVEIPVPAEGAVTHALWDKAGSLWIGAEGSVWRRDSARVTPDTVVETDLQRVRTGDDLTVRLRGVARFNPEGGQSRFAFVWRLDGGPWSDYIAESSLVLPTGRLALGEHRLEVKARDEDLDLDPTPAALTFAVAPIPIQERSWFAPLSTTLALVLFGLTVSTWASRRNLRLANRELEEANRELDARRAEQVDRERRRGEEQVSSIFASSPDLLCMAGVDGLFKRVNPACTKILGYTEHELLSRPAIELVFSEDVMASRNACKSVLAGERIANFRNRLVARDGRKVWLSWHATPVNTDGVIFAAARDITKIIAAETEHENLRRQLQHNQKLEALGVLAGGIAHEFNNILTVIQGNLEIAGVSCDEDSVIRPRIKEAGRAAARAHDLVRRILAFGRRAESDTTSVFDLEVVVREALELLRPTMRAGIALRANLNGGHLLVRGAGSELHQVVVNLVTNACHAIGEKDGEIEVSLDRVEGQARLRVRDTGGGVPPAVVDQIFDPFFTTKAPGEGSGLGLAVVHGFVKSHQGSIELRNQPGLGATFDVLLPITADAVDGRGATTGCAPARGSGEVLIVDDDDGVRSLIAKLLERLGYEPVACIHPDRALELVRRDPERFRALVTDYSMPGMNGLQLARAIRKESPRAAVVLVTGFSEEDARNDPDLGPVEILQKPFRLDDLARALGRALASIKS